MATKDDADGADEWLKPLRESELKAWFRAAWGGALDEVQPNRGSTVGLADLSLHMEGGALLPVELKVGTYDPKLKVVKAKVRPAQVRWHHLFNHKQGGHSIFLVGVGTTRLFSVWLVPGSDVRALNGKGSPIHCRVKAGATYRKNGRFPEEALFKSDMGSVLGWASSNPTKPLDLRFHLGQKL